MQGNEKVLVVRLGAMGDVLHALPAVESLARSFPFASVDWIVKPQWIPLLEGNPHLRAVIPYTRQKTSDIFAVAKRLRQSEYDLVLDLQGLIQSAMVARLSGAKRVVGYAARSCREPLAARFYHKQVETEASHIADRHLEVVAAVGATHLSQECWLPDGAPEQQLPETPFVLASPFAGWLGKQWPLEHYAELAKLLQEHLGVPLVLDVGPQDRERLRGVGNALPHQSSILGLVSATRCAAAIVGVDSGPLHLAALLGKPGVALFGPTDPARNGPLGNSFEVLRDPGAVTTYKRTGAGSESMRRIAPRAVYEAVRAILERMPERPAAGSNR